MEPQPSTFSMHALSTHASSAGTDRIILLESPVARSSAELQPSMSSVDASSTYALRSASTDRTYIAFLLTEESSEHTASTSNLKKCLASQSVMERKFLSVGRRHGARERQRDGICDYGFEQKFFILMPCLECGDKAVMLYKNQGNEYGLCANVLDVQHVRHTIFFAAEGEWWCLDNAGRGECLSIEGHPRHR